MSALVDIALASLAAIGTGMLLEKGYETFDWYPPQPVYLAAVGMGAWVGLQIANKLDQKISKTVAGLGAMMNPAMLHTTTGFLPGFHQSDAPTRMGPPDARMSNRIFANS